MKRAVAAVLLTAALALPAQAATLWDGFSLAVAGNGAWFDQGSQNSDSDIEAGANAALSVTPHVSLVGGLAYGFSESYLRESVGFRLTATDVNDKDFSVGVGVSRHFRSEEGPLDEWAGEAAIGWRPVAASEFILTATGAYGFDSSRSMITAGVRYPLKLSLGASR